MYLSPTVISDPYEFVEKIQTDQNKELYIFLEDVFKPIDNIYDKFISISEKYSPSLIFCDTKAKSDKSISNQYYNDIYSNADNNVILSPIAIRHIPRQLHIYSNLEYHSFSFLHQLRKNLLPWHIPILGFEIDLTNDKFEKITQISQWVMQHVI